MKPLKKHLGRIVIGVVLLAALTAMAMALQAGIEFGRAHAEILRPLSLVLAALVAAYAIGWMVDDQRRVSEL